MSDDSKIIESIAPKTGDKITNTRAKPKKEEPPVQIIGASDLKEKGVEVVSQHPDK